MLIVINKAIMLHRLEFSPRHWAEWTSGIVDTRARRGPAEMRSVVRSGTDSRVVVDLACRIRVLHRTTTRFWTALWWNRIVGRDTRDPCLVSPVARATFITMTLTRWKGMEKLRNLKVTKLNLNHFPYDLSRCHLYLHCDTIDRNIHIILHHNVAFS